MMTPPLVQDQAPLFLEQNDDYGKFSSTRALKGCPQKVPSSSWSACIKVDSSQRAFLLVNVPGKSFISVKDGSYWFIDVSLAATLLAPPNLQVSHPLTSFKSEPTGPFSFECSGHETKKGEQRTQASYVF